MKKFFILLLFIVSVLGCKMMRNEIEHQDANLFKENMDQHFDGYMEAYIDKRVDSAQEKITWILTTSGVILGILVSGIAIYRFAKKKSN